MRQILKPIFEMITGEYILFDNILYNYIAMGIIGLIAFKIAWNFVHKLYDWGIITGSNTGSFAHWSIRTIVFIIVFYIFNLIIWITKFVIKYKNIILILLGIAIVSIIILNNMIKYKKKKVEKENLEDGYLDLKINKYIKGFREKYKNEYNCIKKVNMFFQKIQMELTKKGVTQQNTFIMASLSQLQKSYESSILLFERGLRESGNALIRTILDLSFKIIEVIRNEDFVEDLLLEEQYESLALLNDIETNKIFDMISEQQVKEYKKIVETNINHREKPKTKTIYLANKNKLNREYILYRLQCDYVHQSTGIIGSIIKRTSKGDYYIDGDLQLKNFKSSIAWLLSITTISIKVILEEYIKKEELIKEFNEIVKEFEGDFKDLL